MTVTVTACITCTAHLIAAHASRCYVSAPCTLSKGVQDLLLPFRPVLWEVYRDTSSMSAMPHAVCAGAPPLLYTFSAFQHHGIPGRRLIIVISSIHHGIVPIHLNVVGFARSTLRVKGEWLPGHCRLGDRGFNRLCQPCTDSCTQVYQGGIGPTKYVLSHGAIQRCAEASHLEHI